MSGERGDARKRQAEQHHTHHDAATRELIAAAEARGAERVRDDIATRRRTFRNLNAHPQYLAALDDAYGLANNRARGTAR